MTNLNTFKIGAVSYLNTLPLVHGIGVNQSAVHEANGGPELQKCACRLSFDLPSRLADQLAAGSLDVALIPSIEVFQNPQYTVVSDACIACRGPVWSVKLLSRVPIQSITSLALDEGSRTSIALVRILLERQFGIRPELLPLPIDSDWRESGSDAVLIIGDRAMNPQNTEPFVVEVDLGKWWYDHTGLPFVFAMWTARPGIRSEQMNQIGKVLSASRDAGLAHARSIAESNADRYGLTIPQAIEYFKHFLHFNLGPEERESLNQFRSMAAQLNLAPNRKELQFHDC